LVDNLGSQLIVILQSLDLSFGLILILLQRFDLPFQNNDFLIFSLNNFVFTLDLVLSLSQ